MGHCEIIYEKYLRLNGIPVNLINPGSDEYALNYNDAIKALSILKKCSIGILGGNIFSQKSEALVYAYNYWGSEFHYLNWNCNWDKSESKNDFINKSHAVAESAINEANKIAALIKKPIFISFIITK